MDLLLIISVFLVHLISMNFVFNRGKLHYENGNWTGEVYDIIQNNFPDYSRFNYTKNLYLLVFIVPLLFSTASKQNLSSDLYTFLKWFLVIIFIRALTIPLTILPKQKLCSPKQFNLFHGTIGGTCYDKIFSGHFAFGLLFSFWLVKFNYVSNTTTNIFLLAIINIIHAFILGITRSHYTIDLAVSALVVYLVLNHFKQIN